MSQTEAYRRAVAWVRAEIALQTCIADEEATAAADSFVSGLLQGIRACGGGSLVIEDEMYWRGHYRCALEYDRKHFMGLDEPERLH